MSVGATVSGVPPWTAMPATIVSTSSETDPPPFLDPSRTESAAPLRSSRPVDVDAAHPGLAR